MIPNHTVRLAAGTVFTTIVAVPFVVADQAVADPLPYGPDTCIQGFVWREARPGDTVCVTPDIRATVAQQNSNRGANKDPLAGSGPESCSQGYVWREAFEGDTVCVTPDFRRQMLDANNAAASRKQANAPKPTPQAQADRTATFEVTGSGTVYSIDTDPASSRVGENTAVPFSRTIPIGPDIRLLQVVAVGKTGQQGCRILLDGTVVAEQPVGSSHCTFAIS